MSSNAGAPHQAQGLFGPEMRANPYPFYHRLRSMAPVFWAEAVGGWVLTRYEDVAATLRDQRFSSERISAIEARANRPDLAAMFRLRADSMLSTDAPKHTRLRALVSKAFTPRAVEAMRPTIQAIVDELLSSMQARGHGDLMHDLAYPLPVTVIAAMLGVPPEDRDKFKPWSDAITAGTTDLMTDPSSGVLDRSAQAFMEVVDYFRGVVAKLRPNPGSSLLSAMAQAEEQGDRLTEQELYANAILLLNAGHETTTNLIGNGTLALLRNPDQLKKLRDDPALIEDGIEELLRFDSPVQFTSRVAKEDVELGGQKIKAGQAAVLVLGAANHDPAQFPNPDRLDLARPEARHHVAFGMGPHYCIGAPLARLEGKVVWQTLLRRFPGLHLEGPVPEYRENFNLRGLKALPVAF
jgi:pimeloyl-[acyl-carrier protein] synthase